MSKMLQRFVFNEKISIIANIADDVKVSVKGKDVMIIVSKNFA